MCDSPAHIEAWFQLTLFSLHKQTYLVEAYGISIVRTALYSVYQKLSLFLPELCPFRRYFMFPRFWKIWRETFKFWGFWFRRCLGGLFENSTASPGIFCELRLRPRVFFENFLSFFQRRAGVTLLTAMVIPSLSKALWWWYVENWNENLTSGRWRDRAQKDHRSSPRLVGLRVVCGDPWSKREKEKKKHEEISVWLKEVSTLHHPQTSGFWRPVFETQCRYRFALRCCRVRGCTAAGR